MSDDAKQWRWVGEDGVEKSVSDQELIAELSAESLPNYTLVWHKGWGEWLPAMQVAELSWSLPPGKADDPVQPKEKPGADSPPAPPLYRYPVLKRRAGTLKSDKPPPQKPAPHPPRPASATPAQAAAKGGTIPKPPAPKAKPPAAKPPPQTTKPGLGGAPPVEKKPGIVRPGIATQLGLEVNVAAAKAAARAAQTEQGTHKPLSASVEAGPPTLLGALRVAATATPTKSGVPHVAPPRSHPPPPPSLRKKPEPTETIEADEEVAEVDAELEESRPENPSVGASPAEAALPPIEPIENFESETPHVHAYSEETDDDAETRVVPVRAEPPGPTYVAPHMPPPSEKAPAPSTLPELPRIPPPPAPPSAVGESNVLEVAKRLPPHIYALGGLVAILLLVVIVLAMAKGSDDAEDGKPVASAESSPPEEGADESQQGASRTDHPAPSKTQRAAAAGAAASKAADGCSVKTSAHKLADSAWLGVQPALGQVPGSTRVAIGYAASKSRAVGITIDPVTLDMDQVFREKRRKNLVSVVPVGTDARLRFQVSDDSDDLKAAVAVNASAPFALGLLEGAIARRSLQGGDPAAVWTTGAEEVTVPRVASRTSGHAVALRSGGQAGKVFVGFLTPEGGQKTALWQVEDEKAFAGTPDIGVNETGVAVAFAARGGEDDAWAVHVARAESGQRPSRGLPFKLPPGGPGGNAISPVIAGLHGNSWLLQWTEGASGNRVVRIQILGSRFEPRSDAINLSPQDANAGQGALWVDGETVVALFFVGSGKGHELWGASLFCPR